MVIILIAIVIGVIYYISKRPKKAQVPLSNWRYYFKELGISSQEFFDSVEKKVQDMQIPNVSFSMVTYRQEGIFSASRDYFRISRNEFVIDICSAPFGKGFFISYWLAKTDGGLVAKIPFVNKLLGKDINSKTYYQLDTEAMFKESIHSCIVTVINEISSSKGIRGIMEQEPVNNMQTELN